MKAGSLSVTINQSDTQQTFARRALHDHAIAAGLNEQQANKFADDWTNQKTTFKHYDNGNARPYTATEFAHLKTAGKTNFDLNKEYDAPILADLNERVEEHRPIVAEEAFAYTPEERAAMIAQKQAAANQSAITDKPDMMLTNGLTKGGKLLDADTALGRYIEKNYNRDGRVWGDKINQMVSLANARSVNVELKFNEDGTALVGVNAADKQKLDGLFNQALGETITGERGSAEGQRQGTKMALDVPITLINAVTKAVEGVGNIPATLENLNHAARTPAGVRTMATIAGVPSLIGNAASELMPESAPLTPENRITPQIDLSSLLIPNQSDLFNKDATGKINPNGQTLGKTASTVTSMVIPIPVGKTAEVMVDTAVKLGTKVARTLGKFGEETTAGIRVLRDGELATANGAAPLGKSGNSIDQVAEQTAEDLNSKIVTVDSNGNPSGTRFRSDYESHIKQREFSKVSQRDGVNGCHDINELEKFDISTNLAVTKDSIKILTKTPHPTVKGVYNIEYQMPKLDSQLKATGWRYSSGNKPFVKTVYDSSIIPDSQMMQWGREAFADAMQKNPAISGSPNLKWKGTASNGLEFEGRVDTKGSQAVRTFYPKF